MNYFKPPDAKASVVYRPPYLPTLCVIFGVTAGILDIFLAIFTFITVEIGCILAGLFMLFTGPIILSVETPLNCACHPFMTKVLTFTQSRPPIQRALLYVGIGILNIIMCQKPTAIICGALLMASGICYIVKFIQERKAGDLPQDLGGGSAGGQPGQQAPMGGQYDYTAAGGVGGGGPPPYSSVGGAGDMGSAAAGVMGSMATQYVQNNPEMIERGAMGAARGFASGMGGQGPTY